MSVWLTRASEKDREYIVLKHTLKGANYAMNGVQFRGGYAVVEKDSKTYFTLKKIPVLKSAEEYPLIFLRKLPFITRALDVKLVYGADVYVKYLKQLDLELNKEHEQKLVEQQQEKIDKEKAHVEDKFCCYRTIKSNGKDLCKEKALDQSPSGYCLRHILEEPKLQELGIEVPRFIHKQEKWAMKEKVAKQLTALKKQGKF